MRRGASGLVVAALMVTWAAGGGAQEPAENKSDEKARERYTRGLAAQKAGDCGTAEEEYERARAIKIHYQISGNLGKCELALGKPREALAHFEEAIGAIGPNADAQILAELHRGRDEARAKLGTLRIAVRPKDSTVSVDGAVVDPAKELIVDPGEHRVEAGRPNHTSDWIKVTVLAGETKSVTLEVRPEARPAAPQPTPRRDDDEGESDLSLLPWVLMSGGLAIAGVVVGSVLLVNANQTDDDIVALNTALGPDGCNANNRPIHELDCASLDDRLADFDRQRGGAIGAFVAAGAFTAVAVGLGIHWATRDESEIAFQPFGGLSTMGGSLRGSF